MYQKLIYLITFQWLPHKKKARWAAAEARVEAGRDIEAGLLLDSLSGLPIRQQLVEVNQLNTETALLVHVHRLMRERVSLVMARNKAISNAIAEAFTHGGPGVVEYENGIPRYRAEANSNKEFRQVTVIPLLTETHIPHFGDADLKPHGGTPFGELKLQLINLRLAKASTGPSFDQIRRL
ncbi:unnamed protein product [marine sediment metagenome]|uniref:Uncharacterized protein n=1 Tax=marine sediment metagenome TaxID=412755 RepID=X0TIK4_9ZZZZ